MRVLFPKAALILAAALHSLPLAAQAVPGGNPFDERADLTRPPSVLPSKLRYGSGEWQSVEYWPAKSAPAPLVIQIGTASRSAPTSWLQYRFGREGFAYAIVGYRVDGRVALAAAVADVVKGISMLRAKHRQGRFDPDRILLLGLGTGAQIATLIAADPAHLRQSGIPFEAIRAVATIDGEGFDIPYTLGNAPPHLRSPYRRLFGPSPEEHRRLSPVNHLALPNAPGFLFLAAEDQKRLRDESERAAQAFRAAGLEARAEALPKWREGALSTYLLAEPAGSGLTLLDFFRNAAAAPS